MFPWLFFDIVFSHYSISDELPVVSCSLNSVGYSLSTHLLRSAVLTTGHWPLFLDFRFRQDRAHLEDGDHWQKADEQKQKSKEEPNRPNKHCPVPHRRLIHTPR